MGRTYLGREQVTGRVVRSAIPVTSPHAAFGVLLFPNDDLDELERRNRSNDLPCDPAGDLLPAGTSGRAPARRELEGTISAPGALAGGLWVRLWFGPFASVGDPPEGADPRVVWFTDHAHQLVQVRADPA